MRSVGFYPQFRWRNSGTNKLKNCPRSHNHDLNPGGLVPESVSLTTKCSCTTWKHGETLTPASGEGREGRGPAKCQHFAKMNWWADTFSWPFTAWIISDGKRSISCMELFCGQKVSAGRRSSLSLKIYLFFLNREWALLYTILSFIIAGLWKLAKESN